MESFPEHVRFRSTWRPYQARVLGELDQHLDDAKLHVVAAPGSGKTVLGLEVVCRLNGPTLILAPTLAIRDQWIQRLLELFQPPGTAEPEWISRDLRHPRFLNVATYQALHAAMTEAEDVGQLDLDDIEERIVEEVEEGDSEEEDETPFEEKMASWLSQKKSRNALSVGLPDKLREVGIKTIVLDEAHHLRSSWWKSLTRLIEAFESEVTIVSLTATPPFDAVDFEWERYIELCGPVDAQIAVPELVMEGNLCPHQDLIVFSTPSDAESEEIRRFREEVKAFKKWLFTNDAFTTHVLTHPWVVDPDAHVEEILEEPDYFSSLLIYLKHQGFKPAKEAVHLISDSVKRVPKLDEKWLEILLTRTLYPPGVERPKHSPYLEEVGDELKRIGALERRRVRLKNVKEIEKLLKQSISKLQNIVEIVAQEQSSLGGDLRLVVLTDYIRKAALPKNPADITPLNQIGVVPIFEAIRRENIPARLGILTGSLVVIPKVATQDFLRHAGRMGIDRTEISFDDLDHDDRFSRVSVTSDERHKLTRAMTELFTEGGVEVLVGTKSLLGEGWDVPTINSLIIASFVGSYMLSNQMRGRAIRSQSGNPDKTANIWHLVCVQPGEDDPGPDFSTMKRRFKAFVGVSRVEQVIENGIRRLDIGKPPFKKGHLNRTNEQMFALARDREGMRKTWDQALMRGEEGVRLVEDIQTKKVALPRRFVFGNTISALFWEGVFITAIMSIYWIDGAMGAFRGSEFEGAWTVFLWSMVAGLFCSALVGAPYLLKALWLFIRHGPVRSSIRSIGYVVLKTLCHTGEIRTDFAKMRVVAESDDLGFVYCRLDGGSSREKSVFLRSLQEVLDPIDNPRYLLVRKSSLWTLFTRKDYHAVPTIIGQKKRYAVFFAKTWSRYVGSMDLVYTRNREGRIVLLRSRNHSLSAAFRPKSERVTRWQ
ncbi:MAG: restriction endonuclease subunit R [Candidatus Thorarchaeota archaeon]|nr:MAG: restriction endonuclease subunit R [Candidatus Thorarchaeota archaeon]RLI56094.1 MAG: restriction endonuclease subunit R [Candidatus Thorarchaeota archaeon]